MNYSLQYATRIFNNLPTPNLNQFKQVHTVTSLTILTLVVTFFTVGDTGSTIMVLETGVATEQNPIARIFYEQLGYGGLILHKVSGTLLLIYLDYKFRVINQNQKENGWKKFVFKGATYVPIIMMVLIGSIAVFGNLYEYTQIAAMYGEDPFNMYDFLKQYFI